eukprot:gene27446-34162_t
MKAVTYNQHGDSSVLHLIDHCAKPIPSAGQILVKVSAACVNPVDCKLRANPIPNAIIPLPKIPGSDFSGVVVDICKANQNKFKVGDVVFGMLPLIWSGWGSTAQYVAIDENLLAIAPSKISSEEAASLPLVGLTVLQNFEPFVNSHHHTKNKRVLIQGGSGGVGSFAIQYCKHELGMEVYTTCSTKNVEFVRSLGADHVIDYTREAFEDVVRDCDVVFDTQAFRLEQRTVNSKVLKPGGHYINIASSPNNTSQHANSDPLHLAIPESRIDRFLYKQTAYGMYNLLYRVGLSRYSYGYHFVHPDGMGLQTICRLVNEDRVTAVIDSVYDMKDTPRAHQKVELGHVRGKVVIKIDQ